MNILRTLALVAALLLPSTAFSQTGEEKIAAGKLAAIDSVATDIATKHGIPKDAAVDYIKLALKAKEADEQAKTDGKKVSVLYAEMLDKYSTTFILAQVVLVEGNKIYDVIKDEPVGTVIPKERVAVIRTWASKATVLNRMTGDAATAHMAWNMERFSSSPICSRTSTEFNVSKCIDLMKATVDEFKNISTTLEGAVKAVNIVVFAVVPYMTY